MESALAKKEEKLFLEIYRQKMKDIRFMKQFMDDADIFNPESEKFRNFLVQSYSYLHSDFHHISYSSLLSKKGIDQELVKASQILQILPGNSLKKGEKLFGNMTKAEVHSFWIRFFSLFEMKKDDKQTNLILRHSHVLNKKFDFLKNIDDTLNYINYDFPVFKAKKLKNIDINNEIEKWNAEELINNINECEPNVLKFESNKIDRDFVDKLVIDLNQIVMTYNDLNVCDEEIKSEDEEFFINFVSLTKNILKYKNYISLIDSSFIKDLHVQAMKENYTISTTNIHFLKKINNLIETLRTKIKSLD